MLLIVALVFLAVFAVIALIMTAAGVGASDQTKQALALLDSATMASRSETGDEIFDIRRKELLSAIPWLNRWLVKIDLAPQLRVLLSQADLKWTVGGLVLTAAGCGLFAGYAAYWRTGAGPLALLAGAMAASMPFFYARWKREQRFRRFEQNLPDALDSMVGALRAGHSLMSAIGIVAREGTEPIKREFRICFDEQNFGVELRRAMLNLSERVPIQDMRMLITAVLIQRDSGGNLAEVLEKTAHIIRDRFRLKQQVRVHTAQGRLTGWILSLLPLGLAFALYLINPAHMSVLWRHPLGLKLIYTAAGMTCIGGLIIRKIVRIRI